VVILSAVKLAQFHNFGDDCVTPNFFGLFPSFDEELLLVLTVVKHARAILAPFVFTLTVELGGVMNREENVHDDARGNLLAVESHRYSLCVTRSVRAHKFVGRILHLSTGETTHNFLHSDKDSVRRIQAPEAAAGEDVSFQSCQCPLLLGVVT